MREREREVDEEVQGLREVARRPGKEAGGDEHPNEGVGQMREAGKTTTKNTVWCEKQSVTFTVITLCKCNLPIIYRDYLHPQALSDLEVRTKELQQMQTKWNEAVARAEKAERELQEALRKLQLREAQAPPNNTNLAKDIVNKLSAELERRVAEVRMAVKSEEKAKKSVGHIQENHDERIVLPHDFLV